MLMTSLQRAGSSAPRLCSWSLKRLMLRSVVARGCVPVWIAYCTPASSSAQLFRARECCCAAKPPVWAPALERCSCISLYSYLFSWEAKGVPGDGVHHIVASTPLVAAQDVCRRVALCRVRMLVSSQLQRCSSSRVLARLGGQRAVHCPRGTGTCMQHSCEACTASEHACMACSKRTCPAHRTWACWCPSQPGPAS